MISFYSDPSLTVNNHPETLPPSLTLFNKLVTTENSSRYPNSFAICDSSHQIIIWLRFKNTEIYQYWKNECIEACEGSKKVELNQSFNSVSPVKDSNQETINDLPTLYSNFDPLNYRNSIENSLEYGKHSLYLQNEV